MRQADALLVSLVDRPLFRVTTPSKLQMCLAVARPVLAVARGDVERIVRDSRSGLAVAPGDRAALESAISAMAGHTSAERAEWGRNGLAYYESMMSPAVGGARVMSVLHSVARPQVEPRPTRQEGARR
jgi:glycosyltransferase involved in cell wall biosynthesis